MSVLKFKVNGKEYDFKYENILFDISRQEFVADDVEVTCDGKEKDNYFGVSFGGYSYTVEDVLCAAIVAYVNNDTSYDFISVPFEIKKVRSGFFKKQMTAGGRDIPKQIITPELEVCDVKMITKDGQAAYLGDEATVLTYQDGSIATDMESFFIEGVSDLYQEGDIVFIDPDFEEHLKDNVSESVNVKASLHKIYREDKMLKDKINKSMPKEKYIINKILEGADVRGTISAACNDVSESIIMDASLDMSKPGSTDFITRIYDMFKDEEEIDVQNLKPGPEKDGMPEYVDAELAHIDYDNNRYSWYPTYMRFYPDGRAEHISEREFGK